MKIRELIKILESYAERYGDDIPVRTFDCDRHMSDIDEIDYSIDRKSERYIYIMS